MTTRVRRRGYFTLPARLRQPGRPTTRSIFAMLMLLALATLAYLRFILPSMESLQCGASFAADMQTWIDAGSDPATQPVCESQFPQELRRLEQFLPLLLIVPLAFVVTKQRGNLASLPALAGTQIAIWLSPSPEIALVVGLVGVCVACLPVMQRGWLAALSHIGGLVLWPSIALAVVSAADSSTLTMPEGLSWLVNLALFGLLPGMLIISPITGARAVGRNVYGAVVGFFGVAILVLLFVGASAAADRVAATDLTNADLIETDLTLAESGVSRIYAGYWNTPSGGHTSTFLQSGGVHADVHWNSTSDYQVTFSTAADLPAWTNPSLEPCTSDNGQCGGLAIAIPSEGAPGRPTTWTLNGGQEMDVADGWRMQQGSLELYGQRYHVIQSVDDNYPTGAEITLMWLPWDGVGAPALPAE